MSKSPKIGKLLWDTFSGTFLDSFSILTATSTVFSPYYSLHHEELTEEILLKHRHLGYS